MKNKLLSISLAAATAVTVATPFVAAEPVIHLDDAAAFSKTNSRYNVAPVGPIAPIGKIPKFKSPRVQTLEPMLKQGTQKVLFIMINVDNSPFAAEHNEQFYSDALFGSATDSVKNFIINQSGGKMNIEPAETKNSAVKGIIKVDIEAAKYGTIGAEDFNKQKQILKDVLDQVKDQVDWAAMDTDGNKKFDEAFFIDDTEKKEELVVMAAISGETRSGNYTEEGKIKSWPHTTYFEHTLGEYQFTNNAIISSEKAGGDILSQTILSHEYLHNLNARDMYLDENSIGPWSTMCDTYGVRPGENRTSPTPLDPVHRLYMKWADPKQVTVGEQDTTIQYNKNEVPYIQDPKNPDVVYLLDYRDFSDNNQKALHGFNVTGDGMLVWKINKAEAVRDWFFAATNDEPDWYVNSKGARTAMGVLTKGNGATNAANSYVAVNSICDIEDTGIKITVKDKQMVIKGTGATTPEPPKESLNITAIDREIEVGQQFDPLNGITVRDSKGELVQAKVELVSSNVNVNTEGEYSVTVRATYNGLTAEATYKVTVKGKPEAAKPPVIYAENKVINKGDSFNAKDGVTAKDGEGNDITASLKVVESGVKTDTPGVYQVTYEVADKDGVKATKTITVTVLDTKPNPKPDGGDEKPDGGEEKPGGGNEEKPDSGEDKPNPKPQPPTTKDSIPPKFEGVKDLVLQIGSKFNPLEGVTAVDEVDGNVKIQYMPAEIDTSKPGKHTITYYAFDKSGNMASYERVIEISKSKNAGDSVVADKSAPDIKLYDTEFSFPKGHNINPLSFVTAEDDTDGDLTDKVQIVGKVPDLRVPGIYNVKVAVTDKAGNRKEAEMKFNIRDGKLAIYAPALTVTVGAKVQDLGGVTAISTSGTDITDKLKVDLSKVDTSKPGEYKVIYSVKDFDGTEIFVERNIFVVENEADTIRPNISFTNNVIKKGATFNEMDGVESKDDVKLISGKVDPNTSGIYHLVYEAKNAKGNIAQEVRRVIVFPKELTASAPYIFSFNNKIPLGEKFNAKEAMLVLDKEDGLLNSKLLIEKNDVDVNRVGRYNVKYSVIDSDANATSHIASIEVVAKPLADPPKPGEAVPQPGKDKEDKKPFDLSGFKTENKNKKPNAVMGNLPKTGTTMVGCGALVGAVVSGILRFGRKRH